MTVCLHSVYAYLVGGLEHFYCPYKWNNHPKEVIFVRGVETTNQISTDAKHMKMGQNESKLYASHSTHHQPRPGTTAMKMVCSSPQDSLTMYTYISYIQYIYIDLPE